MWRRVGLTFVLCVLVGVPLAVWALRRFERAVVFHPERYAAGDVWRVPGRGEDVWINVGEGERLHGWFVRAGGAEPAAAATVIYFHGNGGNINGLGWVGEELSARGFDVLLFDYRGYGRSDGAVSDERRIYEDADAAYDYVVRVRGVSPRRVVLYGQSLGTTAAVDVASRRECAGVVLESGLSSASEMASLVLPWLPRALHRFARNRLDSARKLSQVSCPVLVAHGTHDEVIPVEQGRALYAAAREPKQLVIVPGAGHNNLVATGGDAYLDTVARFIRGATASNGASQGAQADGTFSPVKVLESRGAVGR
ncbi:MAG TPA: alpha/beta fold hydrolase [Pyrinomonadaceae bacterium]